MIIPETIPEMRARYERQIADLQGQIERLTLDLHQANTAREKAEADRAGYWGALWRMRNEVNEIVSRVLP